VDVREPYQFALGHPPGSLNVPYSRKGLGDRLTTIYSSTKSVVIMANTTEQAQEATEQLQNKAFTVLGVITDSMEEWVAGGLPVQTVAEISANSISAVISDKPHSILDVREPIEWEMGHVPGAILISLGELKERLEEVPNDIPLIIICEAGIRSSSAASVLQAYGINDIKNVTDGTAGYRNSNLPMEFYDGGE